MLQNHSVAVLIPCFNEEISIGNVVRSFRNALPDAEIYVYDNNSTDQTATMAHAAGAIVRQENRQGKGNVVRRMFADVEADIYLMVDGDDTYDAASAPVLVHTLIDSGVDMVTAVRQHGDDSEAYRFGHVAGNRMLTGAVSWIFGFRTEDMLSGYRAFSRRFIKSFPALATGFEIETELTVHSLELGMPTATVATPYYSRPLGSSSKLSTLKDGFRILLAISRLLIRERPLRFYGAWFALLGSLSIALAIPLMITYAETGLVPRFPTAILASAIMILGFLSLTAGVILDTVTHSRREIRRLAYLASSGRIGTGAAADHNGEHQSIPLKP